MNSTTEYAIEPMRVEHIPAVSVIERYSFPQPWPQNAYKREIQENKMAHYVVARQVRVGEEPVAPVVPQPVVPEPPGGLIARLSRLLHLRDDGVQAGAAEGVSAGIVGYAGMWLMTDEAHITTIASHPDVRGRGVGELLLLAMIDRSLELGARWITLEVRATNEVAQALYQKYTFKEMGVRKRYYSDNNEDALVMWTDALDSPTFMEALERNEHRLAERIGAEIRLGERTKELGRVGSQ